MADARRWWRIEVGADGKVVSCRQVEDVDAGQNGGGVFYVKALNRADAGRLAWNDYCRRQQQHRHVELKAQGKCPYCGRPNDRTAGKRCSFCLSAESGRKKAKRATARGELVELPNRAASIAARANDERRELRLALLGEVREAFEQMSTVGEFARWLAQRIRAESPSQPAAKKTGT